jgi:hypothetical protein
MAQSGPRKTDDGQPETELKVTDRRLFHSDGQLREGARERQEEEERQERAPRSEAPSGTRTERAEPPRRPGFEHRPLREPAEVDFTMLLNAMAQPALLFLGELVPPGSGEPRVDLEQARLQIDMLELLRVKCRGNLTAEEEGLLDRILYQLRMLYVARSSGGPNR